MSTKTLRPIFLSVVFLSLFCSSAYATDMTLTAVSVGANYAYDRGGNEWNTFVKFTKSISGVKTKIFNKKGAGGGGRGLDIAVLNPTTGAVEDKRNFDTWYDPTGASDAFVSYVNSIANGKIVMCATADAAFPAGQTLRSDVKQVLQQQLGSTLIGNLVFRGSWALISRKGSPWPSWKKESYCPRCKVKITTIVPLVQGLSIRVDPEFWDIVDPVPVSSVTTMPSGNKLTVTNDGTVAETLLLHLTNPAGWTASTAPGNETYVMSGLFCKTTDVPVASHFNQSSTEDVLLTTAKTATASVFAYSSGTANGVAVPSGSSRSFYLQFKSPTTTTKTTKQQINVIVSCQIP